MQGIAQLSFELELFELKTGAANSSVRLSGSWSKCEIAARIENKRLMGLQYQMFAASSKKITPVYLFMIRIPICIDIIPESSIFLNIAMVEFKSFLILN